ncbi:MaoC/PaaZ C-terminal domain-containing protein [Saccharopolyspora sp. NPDC003752]
MPELSTAPKLSALYLKAVATGPTRRGDGLPDTEYLRRDIEIDRDQLAEYNRVCGFGLRDELPITYPHVLSFPLSVRLMTDPGFPFPLVGLVHVTNTIRQERPLLVTDVLTQRVRVAGLRPHPKGRQFDVITETSAGGEVVWREVSTYLRRGGAPEQAERGEARPRDAAGEPARQPGEATPEHDEASGQPGKPTPDHDEATRQPGKPTPDHDEATRQPGKPTPDHDEATRQLAAASELGEASGQPGEATPDREATRQPAAASELGTTGEPTATWRVPGDTGRRYAAVSGDRNPIHLHPLTAKAFGFPRAIAHGMWSKARCLAAFAERLPDAYSVDVEFRKPLLLPSTVDFTMSRQDTGWNFALHARSGKPHLFGEIR